VTASPSLVVQGTRTVGYVATVQADGSIAWAAAAGGGGGAPTTADYLVGTTQAGLSAEIVVGATPGGELGGTWAAPTVDAVHSGSSHAATQAAAEATAAAALLAHDRASGWDANWVIGGNVIPANLVQAVNFGINGMFGVRTIITKTGTISDFAIGVASSSGNIDAGIYTFDGTTYTRVWSKGSTACPASNTWTSLGNPGVAVTVGDIIFLCYAQTVTAATFMFTTLSTTGWLLSPPGVEYPRYAFAKASTFPLPATLADSGVATTVVAGAMMVKIT
jgi:hypothetical protein